ncbi:cytochrome c [Acidobacteria bacterium AH-259-G07]|nr:cytochrome c [Acidobacteria bacterium AH-259-G07]
MSGNSTAEKEQIERPALWRSRAKVMALCSALLLLASCRGWPSERPPVHLNPNMDKQPKYLPQAQSRFFYTGAAMQVPVPGTVARGELRENEEFYTGKSFWGFFVPKIPMEVNEGLISRGRERYQIYCTPCHGERGDGHGMLSERAGVRTANLLEERIREMPDGRIYYVISNGVGLMPSYRYPIQPRDRWAIVSHVRRLQQESN